MASIEVFRDLMDGYAKHLGFKKRILDENDILGINVDQVFDVNIAYNSEKKVICIVGYVPIIDNVGNKEDFYLRMLKENFKVRKKENIKIGVPPGEEAVALILEKSMEGIGLTDIIASVDCLIEVSSSVVEICKNESDDVDSFSAIDQFNKATCWVRL